MANSSSNLDQLQRLASVRSTLRYLLLSLVASALRCYIPALRTDWGRVVLEKGHHPHTGLMVANLVIVEALPSYRFYCLSDIDRFTLAQPC